LEDAYHHHHHCLGHFYQMLFWRHFRNRMILDTKIPTKSYNVVSPLQFMCACVTCYYLKIPGLVSSQVKKFLCCLLALPRLKRLHMCKVLINWGWEYGFNFDGTLGELAPVLPKLVWVASSKHSNNPNSRLNHSLWVQI
jgi:hypothetical protein